DDAGNALPPGGTGNIGVRAPDPLKFIGYWRRPEATREKFAADFLLTADLGIADADRIIRLVARNHDGITSAGYRIGPG
ncbi:AMP-dependent synthetase, partial [Burkholderia pseudomallei]